MCDPATAVMAIIAVAGATASYVGAEQTAKSQNRYAKAQAKEGEKLAHENFRLQNEAESERTNQEREAQAAETLDIQRDHAKARATARVASAEGGVSGLSVDALLAEFNQQESEELGALSRNAYFGERQSRLRRMGYRAEANQNIGRTRFAPINRPNQAAYAAQVAGAGVQAYKDGTP